MDYEAGYAMHFQTRAKALMFVIFERINEAWLRDERFLSQCLLDVTVVE